MRTMKVVILLLMTFILASCSKQPKVTEAGNYVEMKTELAKLTLYKSQLASLKDSLTDVPTNIYSRDWKPREKNIDKLSFYLEGNNCLNTPLYKECYINTRLLLITTTKELDAANDQINALNTVVDRLMGNINGIIDNFDDTKAEAIKKDNAKK